MHGIREARGDHVGLFGRGPCDKRGLARLFLRDENLQHLFR
jgi:hypothetical protein